MGDATSLAAKHVECVWAAPRGCTNQVGRSFQQTQGQVLPGMGNTLLTLGLISDNALGHTQSSSSEPKPLKTKVSKNHEPDITHLSFGNVHEDSKAGYMVALASNMAVVSGKQLTPSGGPGTCPANPVGKKGISEQHPPISPHLPLPSVATCAAQLERTASTRAELSIAVTCLKKYYQSKKAFS